MNMNLNMDSFVSKLRNTVSQVAYQMNTSVNTIIPGNAIHREYETLKLRCTHGSPGLVWSVYDAVKRDTASIKASLKDAIGPNLMPNSSQSQIHVPNEDTLEKQLYSVFVFDKSQLDTLGSKVEREAALDHIKKGVTKLTRLRHPAVLIVHHPLEESRSSLAFVTEHVYGHLESILKEQRRSRTDKKTNRQTSDLVDFNQDLGPKDSDYQNDSCHLDEVQIRAGLLQVCDGIRFLHNDAKLLHRNLCLDNIFVDSNNTWKIAGFDFSLNSTLPSTSGSPRPANDDASLQIVEFTPKISTSPQFPSLKTTLTSMPSSIVPNWSCSAPEHSNNDQVTFASDVYSLGIISCALLGQEMDMMDLSYEYGLISDTYKRGIRFRELVDRLPMSIKSSMMKYAAINVDVRPSLEDYQNLSIFNDQQVQAIRDLDSQFAWDRLRKIDFFNRLRDILPKLSHQIKINRITKSLSNEVYNLDMVPHVLPCILIIAKDSTPTEFRMKIFPALKSPFRILEPQSVPLMILDNMVMLADRAKLCLPEFQQAAFTLIQYILKMDQRMQERCLTVLADMIRFIDNKSMTEIILPELNRLCKESNILAVRVKTLECIGKMVDGIESGTLVRQVLPIVFEMPTKEADMIMAATTIVKTIVNEPKVEVNKELLTGKILPFLIPLCVERDLNLQQFNILMTLIRNLMDRVEREQREILGRKSQFANPPKSSPLVLDSFKGSNHFLID